MKKLFTWFTLIEVLTVIAILWIIGWGVSQINFNTINDKEKSQTLAQRILGRVQTIRNYSLSWKAIWASLYTPSSRKIDIQNGTGGMVSSYMNNVWVWIQINDGSYSMAPWEIVTNIKCIQYFNTGTTSDITWIWSISFTSTGISLPTCPDASYNVLQIKVRNGRIPTTIEVNTINWIIQEV